MPGVLKTCKAAVAHVNVADMQEREKNKLMPAEKDGKVLHPDLLNPRLLEAQYAVRGELYLRAQELKATKEIIYTNGNGCSCCMACWRSRPAHSERTFTPYVQSATHKHLEPSPSLLCDRCETPVQQQQQQPITSARIMHRLLLI